MSAEFDFTQSDFSKISSLAHQLFGLNLESSKRQLVYSRLSKRLRKLEVSSFKEYLEIVKNSNSDEEIDHFLSALTTNVTHFFRENHHFAMIEDQILPVLLSNGDPIRLWSAGCSAGPEPISMAITISEYTSKTYAKDIKILATDIDKKILQKAQGGFYSDTEISGVPDHLLSKYFIRCEKPRGFKVKKSILDLISFRQLNLVGDWPIRSKFDVIFCRNVAIYFDKDTQDSLWEKFSNQLKPKGHLMIGHSERISGSALDSLNADGVTTYQKH